MGDADLRSEEWQLGFRAGKCHPLPLILSHPVFVGALRTSTEKLVGPKALEMQFYEDNIEVHLGILKQFKPYDFRYKRRRVGNTAEVHKISSTFP